VPFVLVQLVGLLLGVTALSHDCQAGKEPLVQPLRLAPGNSLRDDAGLLNANEFQVEAKVPLQWQLVTEAVDVASNDCRV